MTYEELELKLETRTAQRDIALDFLQQALDLSPTDSEERVNDLADRAQAYIAKIYGYKEADHEC